MEQTSSLASYREKMNEVHTQEEILQAFDTGFALCFEVASRAPAKQRLIADLCKISPDIIVTTADVCVFSTESSIKRDQILLIYNGDKETSDKLIAALEKSTVVSDYFLVFSAKKNGVKGCIRAIVGESKPSVVKQINLLADGNRLLATVRAYQKPKLTS